MLMLLFSIVLFEIYEEATLKFQPEMVLTWRVLKMKISAWQVFKF